MYNLYITKSQHKSFLKYKINKHYSFFLNKLTMYMLLSPGTIQQGIELLARL